jgi:hypothetical protein
VQWLRQRWRRPGHLLGKHHERRGLADRRSDWRRADGRRSDWGRADWSRADWRRSDSRRLARLAIASADGRARDDRCFRVRAGGPVFHRGSLRPGPSLSRQPPPSQPPLNSWTMRNAFNRGADRVNAELGSVWALVLSVLVVVVWALTGPIFRFSDTWQLAINTATTVVTFWMVFVIQNSQNRASKAALLKLDEVIRALDGAENSSSVSKPQARPSWPSAQRR